MSSCPGGPAVSHRKLPSSGSETSSRTSMPTFSVQYFNATSWSCTQSWALEILIMSPTLRPAPVARLLPVCCLDPAVRGPPGVPLQYAIGHPGIDGGGGHARAVGRRWHPIHAGEAGSERPDALQSDH